MRLEPNHKYAHCHKGERLMQLGNHAGAVSCLDRGTRMDPNSNTAACLYAGSALQRLDRHAESIIRFDLAIRLEPSYSHTPKFVQGVSRP